MKLRCELHLNNTLSRVILVQKPEETLDHLALKLAGYAMFHDRNPIVEPSAQHPALAGGDHKPDVMVLNDAGEIAIWIECGAVSEHKLGKVSRRYPNARFVVIKKSIREADRLRETLRDEVRNDDRIEIWTWPEGTYVSWLNALGEKTEIFGDAHERSMNLVVNEQAYLVDLVTL